VEGDDSSVIQALLPLLGGNEENHESL